MILQGRIFMLEHMVLGQDGGIYFCRLDLKSGEIIPAHGNKRN